MEKLYRQTLSELRAYSNVIEVKMCANKWDEIDYNKVPSKANLLYKNAFLKHDEVRRVSWLEKLKNVVLKNLSIDEDVKINAKAAFPHEIVANYRDNKNNGWWWYTDIPADIPEEDATLECMWATLMETLPEDMGKTLCVVDGSGSMYSNWWNCEGPKPIEVAMSLAIYFAERNKGAFKNHFVFLQI